MKLKFKFLLLRLFNYEMFFNKNNTVQTNMREVIRFYVTKNLTLLFSFGSFLINMHLIFTKNECSLSPLSNQFNTHDSPEVIKKTIILSSMINLYLSNLSAITYHFLAGIPRSVHVSNLPCQTGGYSFFVTACNTRFSPCHSCAQ